MVDETQTDSACPPRLLAAARVQFLDIGFEDSSIDAIAKAARVSKQTVYAHFRDKAALFEATVRASLRGMSDELGALAESAAASRDLLIRVARWTYDSHLLPDNLGLYRANIAAATRFPELAEEIHRARRGTSDELAAWMAAWTGPGRLSVSDPLRAALLFGNLSVGGLRGLMGYEPAEPAVREQAFARVADLFLQGRRRLPAPAGAVPWMPEAGAVDPVPRAPGMRLPADRLAALLEASAAGFLAQGVRRSRIDRLVAGTGVGVTTVYRQYGGKPGLFEAAVRHLLDRLDRETPAAGGHSLDTTDLEAALAVEAEGCLDRFLHPLSVGLLRLAVTEAPRMPALARLVHERIWRRAAGTLPQRLAPLGFGDPVLAADEFLTMATHGHLFLTGTHQPAPAERRQLAQDAAALFLHGLRRPDLS